MSLDSVRVFQRMKILAISFCLITISYNATGAQKQDVSSKNLPCETVYFRINEHVVDTTYSENASKIAQARKAFNEIFNNENIVVDSITINAKSSPDGIVHKNLELAELRSESLKNLLLTMIPPGKEHLIHAYATAPTWEALIEDIQNDPNIPDKEEVLAIIQNRRITNYRKGEELKSLNSRRAYDYIAKNLLPKYRDADYCMVWYSDATSVPPVEKVEIEEKETPEPIEQTDPPAAERKNLLAIKTNALFLAATVTNIGVEVPIGQKFSIDVPFTYTPYMFSRKYRIEVLGWQPEFRFWLNEALDGSFFGLHGHVAWYNVSFNDKNRFQDKDGDSPLWGLGLSYGYSKSLSKSWAIEFTVGAGYANIEYDVFNNYRNGQKSDSGQKNYWGITRAGINLVYKINK